MKSLRSSAGLLLACLFALSANSAWAASARSHTKSAPTAKEVLAYVNEYRHSRGLSPLVMNQALSLEAMRHSEAMAAHLVPFGHVGFEKRMKHIYRNIKGASGGAENVAYNYKTAKIVVNGWIHSPGHHKNIIGAYQLTGIGIAKDDNGKLYYTELFVRTSRPAIRRLHHVLSSQPKAHKVSHLKWN